MMAASNSSEMQQSETQGPAEKGQSENCRPGWLVIANINANQQTQTDLSYNSWNDAESSFFRTKQSFTVVKETVNVSCQKFQFLFPCRQVTQSSHIRM